MRLLLDTHILLWAMVDDPSLGHRARHRIEDEANEIFVSAVSIWEIAIKHGHPRGRTDDMPISGDEALNWLSGSDYELLPILPAHAAAVGRLPALHADPFDRLLIAQALYEPLHLLTRDRTVASYSDTFILM